MHDQVSTIIRSKTIYIYIKKMLMHQSYLLCLFIGNDNEEKDENDEEMWDKVISGPSRL